MHFASLFFSCQKQTLKDSGELALNDLSATEDSVVADDVPATPCDLSDVPLQFQKSNLKYKNISEMDKTGIVLGMQTGFVFIDKVTREKLPKAKIEYYNSTPDMAYLVSTGKLDGFINDEPVIRYCALEYPTLGYIHCGIDAMDYVVCFPKNKSGNELRNQMNEFIERMRSSGELEKLDSLWLSDDEDLKVVSIPSAKKGQKILKMATCATNAPFEYIKNGKIVGYEIDLVSRFCFEYGYALEIQNVPFDSLILGLQTGMYDFVAS